MALEMINPVAVLRVLSIIQSHFIIVVCSCSCCFRYKVGLLTGCSVSFLDLYSVSARGGP